MYYILFIVIFKIKRLIDFLGFNYSEQMFTKSTEKITKNKQQTKNIPFIKKYKQIFFSVKSLLKVP